MYLLILSGVLTSCLFILYFYFLTGGDEPILSYEAVVQQECKLISIRCKNINNKNINKNKILKLYL